MFLTRPTMTALFILPVLLSGCDQSDLEIETEAEAEATTLRNWNAGDPDRGVWLNNGLQSPNVTGIDPAFALSTVQGLANDLGLLDDDRLETAEYLVECALPASKSITKVVDGQTLTFDGLLGLAPEWRTGACNEDCQEWVSACMLARTNTSGQPVQIWMQAEHPAIGMGSSLYFSQYEASFFGNLFAEEVSLNYCEGTVLGPLLGQLQGRTCAGLTEEACPFEQYSLCEFDGRCEFESLALGLLGPIAAPTAIDCEANDEAFHTISTFVAPLSL